jgi:DNA-binding response OmpR family regulator
VFLADMHGQQLLVIDDSATVLKVVEVALTKAGFEVATATGGAAGLALAREAEPVPELVLLGSMMSDIDTNGAACCRAMAADPRLAAVPVVLMVTKGDDVEEKLAKASNVADYITKPFSPEALTAVVAHVIDKRRQRGGAAATGPGQGPEVVAEALSHAAPPARDGDADRARAEALGELREALAQRLESHRQESLKWDIPELVRGALDDATLAALLSAFEMRAGAGKRAGGEARTFSGDIGAVSISDALALLRDEGQTGTLRVLQGNARVEIHLRGGKIDFAGAAGVSEEFLLGRFAIEAGDLTPDSLTAVLDERARSTVKPLLGADLVARGLLTEAQLKQAMTRQTSELVLETLRWTEGTFLFRTAPGGAAPDLARGAALAIPIDTLLMEGYRRVDEWRIIEREIDSFDLVLTPNESRIAEMARGQLTRDEIAVLELVNGRNQVKEIIRGLRMGSFDVSKILYRLLRTKLIRRRVMPAAT